MESKFLLFLMKVKLINSFLIPLGVTALRLLKVKKKSLKTLGALFECQTPQVWSILLGFNSKPVTSADQASRTLETKTKL